MNLSLENLEQREVPAVDIGNGLLKLDNGVIVDVYGDSWRGLLNVATTADAVYVGPGPGGGPRLAKLDLNTGNRLTNDVFIGSEGDRSGLIPLAVGGETKTITSPTVINTIEVDQKIPQLTSNPGRTGLTYINFEPIWQTGSPDINHKVDAAYITAVFNEVARIYQDLDLTVTTVYPGNMYPGAYATIDVLPLPTFSGKTGNTPERMIYHTTYYEPDVTYAGVGGVNPLLDAQIVAHEGGHQWQPPVWSHESGTVMDGQQIIPGAGFSENMKNVINKNIYDIVINRQRIGLHYDQNNYSNYVGGPFVIDVPPL